MKFAICEDTEKDLLSAEKLLKEYFISRKIDSSIKLFSSADNLLSGGLIPDIILLDIEMKGINGIELSQKLHELNPDILILITTNYMGYLDDAMRVNVFRYISKPIEKQRLFRNLDDACRILKTSSTDLLIESKGKNYIVKPDDIIFIEIEGRKTLIHTVLGDIKSEKNINYWDEQLIDFGFYRTYRSHIVNMKYITAFTHDEITVIKGEKSYTAFLTRRKYKEFKNAYLFYKGRNI